MRSMILAVAAGASMALAGFSAQAMPAGAIVGASAAPQVTLVAGGCGPRFHPGPYGGCVRNFYRPYAPVVVAPAYGYYRPYARCGLRIGPIGIGGPC